MKITDRLRALADHVRAFAKPINGADLSALIVVSFVAVAITTYTDAIGGILAATMVSVAYAYFKGDRP